MQTILIPTDFNNTATDCLPQLCSRFEGDNIQVIFLHMFKLSDSISDLLMLSKRSRDYECISDEFYNNCTLLKREYPQITDIKIEFLYGSTLNLFRNFIEANGITHILDNTDCSTYKINKTSIDPAVLIKRCGLPVITLDKVQAPKPVQKQEEVPAEQLLDEISV